MILIQAGGRGERLKPLTDTVPKPMLKIHDRPILEWIIKRFVDQGFTDITISIKYLGNQIKEYFDDGKNFGCHIRYVEESIPLGTAGALGLLDVQSDPVIVINGDVLASVNYKDLLKYHKNHGCLATIGATTHRVEIPFGVLKMDNFRLQSIEEKPAFNYPIAAGIYVLSAEALLNFPSGYIDMPDFIGQLPSVSVFPISGDWRDIGRHEDLCSMNR